MMPLIAIGIGLLIGDTLILAKLCYEVGKLKEKAKEGAVR